MAMLQQLKDIKKDIKIIRNRWLSHSLIWGFLYTPWNQKQCLLSCKRFARHFFFIRVDIPLFKCHLTVKILYLFSVLLWILFLWVGIVTGAWIIVCARDFKASVEKHRMWCFMCLLVIAFSLTHSVVGFSSVFSLRGIEPCDTIAHFKIMER